MVENETRLPAIKQKLTALKEKYTTLCLWVSPLGNKYDMKVFTVI